jgi:hypothetical protein
VNGVAHSALAVLAPVKQGTRDRLLAALAALDDRQLSPFAMVPGTHFGRWVFVRALKGPAGGLLESEGSFLLLSAEFDPPLPTWTASLCREAAAELDAVMGNCEGFPGSANPVAVTAYFSEHATAAGFTVQGYRQARVEEVHAALALRAALRALAAQADELDGPKLRERWRTVAGR